MSALPIRPMLAVTADYPVTWSPAGFWVQPKFDGIRCLIDPVAGPVTRTGQPIANTTVREMLSDAALIGLDGELTAPGGLEAAQSAFTGSRPPPDGWRFTAFDDLTAFGQPFSARQARLRRRGEAFPAFALASPGRLATAADELPDVFAALLDDHRRQDPATHLDGFCLRAADRAYHEGKASAWRGELIKLKPMDEAEAIILDVSARSDDGAAVGAVQVRLGSLVFWTPLALDRSTLQAMWSDQAALVGSAVTLRWWGTTARGLPRHAVAVAIRRDLPA